MTCRACASQFTLATLMCCSVPLHVIIHFLAENIINKLQTGRIFTNLSSAGCCCELMQLLCSEGGALVLVLLVMSDVEGDLVFEGRAAGVVDGWRFVCCHPVRSLGRVEVITVVDRLIIKEND